MVISALITFLLIWSSNTSANVFKVNNKDTFPEVIGTLTCSGQPLADTYLRLLRVEGESYSIRWSATSDENGNFSFGKIRPGKGYFLMIGNRPLVDRIYVIEGKKFTFTIPEINAEDPKPFVVPNAYYCPPEN